ncbi:PREDICTED: LOW QUALITY PROTEIN: uncharacterized protein LOC105312502 [Amphimedon queenslandica]|uniref:Iminophenyl-pyruvate dimer synthase domain-containing protein n=2 Tax=Amphimedon queenslandica TaxID=400682 RepID=A0AAN0J368_AMPQE|nr:PREDICTED: LOW QUALITY PROTEIN: uncharacterized protein LOC105312502 [Amphimedon queenslandica]|eukprot:XP_019851178.1 PREDICTED: LOW QUALITY PROTEIN: uncharacterized protein LOC105312502 [Amphimedon queenslandica]
MNLLSWNPISLLLTFMWIFSFSQASYLDFPRVHFYGKYRADASTPNNYRCNFDPNIDDPFEDDPNGNWNYIGTNEFSIQDTSVTGVTTDSGVTDDEVIGAAILDSGNHPFAKMVDIDTEWQGAASVIYGMVFRIVWSDGAEALRGNWTPSSISQSMWKRMVCTDGGSSTQGALSTTTINDIEWGDLRGSTVLKKLKGLSTKGNNKLQLSVSLSGYGRENNGFTRGLMTGTIGVSKDTEPLNYGGERLLSKTEIKHPPDISNIPPEDSCSGPLKKWMSDAPFEVNGDLLSIDLSNSLPSDSNGNLLYINPLYAGILHDQERVCIEVLGNEIHYCGQDHSGSCNSNDWLKSTGGIVDIELNYFQKEKLLSSSSLVLALMQDKSSETNEVYPNCYALPTSKHNLKLMLKETNYYMRPKEEYSFFIHPSVSMSVSVPFLVSQFGEPVANLDVKVGRKNNPIPYDGVSPSLNVKTDENGVALFTFTAVKEMSSLREYSKPPCKDSAVMKLPIDGQVYAFDFCPSEGEEDQQCASFSLNSLVIRAFSNPEYDPDKTYTWVDHIQPIFSQYHHLYPVMHGILNLSNYYSVTSPQNIGLLNLSMSLDINDASYMPVTRDLPEPQRKMILKWLENPVKQLEEINARMDDTSEVLPELQCDEPNHIAAISMFEDYAKLPTCQARAIPFNIKDYCEKFVDQYYFATLQIPKSYRGLKNKNCPEDKRPLYKYKKNSQDPEIQKKCTDENLWEQLQIGLKLELATIPLYMTSLYSIGDGCNTQVYKTIRGILMQEMLHLALVGNIINAMNGGHPIIDSPDVAPKYPSVGLPGCVHPSLKVHLEKVSRKHIYTVPLVLEKPKLSCVTEGRNRNILGLLLHNTIGEFYTEIEQCMQKFEENGEEVFQPNNFQVSWPWTPF